MSRGCYAKTRKMENRTITLVRDGQAAAQAGQKARTRRRFRAALVFDPSNVTALLWLAWLSDNPRASLAYIARALACAPHDSRAHAALRWARRRVASPVPQEPPSTSAAPASRPRWNRPVAAVVLGLLAVIIGGGLAWFLRDGADRGGRAVLAALASTPSSTAAAIASHTSTPTPTLTHIPTLPSTSTPISTSTPTLPLIPSSTPTASPRSVLPTAPPFPPTATLAPHSIPSNIRWIDVDLTHQAITAYEGQTVVRTTLVSTGLSRTPTPIGQYRIWIKLRYDNMSGPGYYLSNVPYVMYFHRGYGLHGTYWHNNFGHPMSHGCVNLPTPEAEWLFAWADVGTLVNIHY